VTGGNVSGSHFFGLLNGKPLPTCFVSKGELEASIAPEAIPTASTYIVTLKSEGEALPGPYRA